MPKGRRRIAVVGGANVDIGGFPTGTLVPEDSNPGTVRISAGGVGRNIAENAARLGLDVELVTAIGDDANGRMLAEDCRAKGIGIGDSFIDAQAQTSVYLFIGDAQGDMYCAVSDMDIQKGLTPERLAGKLDMLNSRDAVVIDANLPEETIFYLTQNLRVPVFADSVSVAKAGKLRRSLGSLYALKVNRIEAELLTGMQIRDALDASEAARCEEPTGERNRRRRRMRSGAGLGALSGPGPAPERTCGYGSCGYCAGIHRIRKPQDEP